MAAPRSHEAPIPARKEIVFDLARGLLGEGIAAFKALCDLGRILNRG
jgi:hypothetical protein